MDHKLTGIKSSVAAEAQWQALRVQDASASAKPGPSKAPRQDHDQENESWLKRKMKQLGNNVRLIDLYARQKDFYKLFEMLGPILAYVFPWDKVEGSKPKHSSGLTEISGRIDDARGRKTQFATQLQGLLDEKAERPVRTFFSRRFRNERRAAERGLLQATMDEAQGITDYRTEKITVNPRYQLHQLNQGLVGDTLNFGLNIGISQFSAWWEKSTVVRTYEDLIRTELNISGQVKFSDLKKSKNPIVKEAADYYGRKSVIRMLPDFAGLIRWVPRIYFGIQQARYGQDGWAEKSKDSATAKFMWQVADKIKGIPLLIGLKTFFFSWYFLERQTGSFYESENIWNKTEGVAKVPNRALNQNILPGEFVTRQEIATLYVRFREENPGFGLQNFTPDDPLSSRVFEQVARYLNRTYMPKLFAITEPGKQADLRDKRLTHAMLIELVGTKGLRVEDAIGSAIKLEILAHYGSRADEHGPKLALKKYHEVSAILDNIPHPQRTDFLTLDDAVEGIRGYYSKMQSIAQEYLGDAWPPHYVEHEIKPGFIKFIFGETLSKEQFEYISSALAVSGNHVNNRYEVSPYEPAASIDIDGGERAPVDLDRGQPYYTLPQTQTPPTSNRSHTPSIVEDAPSKYTEMAEQKGREAIKPRSLKDFAVVNEQVPEGVSIN